MKKVVRFPEVTRGRKQTRAIIDRQSTTLDLSGARKKGKSRITINNGKLQHYALTQLGSLA